MNGFHVVDFAEVGGAPTGASPTAASTVRPVVVPPRVVPVPLRGVLGEALGKHPTQAAQDKPYGGDAHDPDTMIKCENCETTVLTEIALVGPKQQVDKERPVYGWVCRRCIDTCPIPLVNVYGAKVEWDHADPDFTVEEYSAEDGRCEHGIWGPCEICEPPLYVEEGYGSDFDVEYAPVVPVEVTVADVVPISTTPERLAKVLAYDYGRKPLQRYAPMEPKPRVKMAPVKVTPSDDPRDIASTAIDITKDPDLVVQDLGRFGWRLTGGRTRVDGVTGDHSIGRWAGVSVPTEDDVVRSKLYREFPEG
jgi:hypothetical protein